MLPQPVLPSDQLLVSRRPDRAGARPLQGATLRDEVAIFARPEGDPDRVVYTLQGQAPRPASTAPFDFVASTREAATLFDTRTLAEGEYTLQAELWRADEHLGTMRATFVVARVQRPPLPASHQPPPDAPLDITRRYYLDCQRGDDRRNGLAQDTAWRTLTRVNGAELKPGDALLLRRGCSFTGPLTARWQGSPTRPILISAYGSGPLPIIQDSKDHNVQITGNHLVVENLHARADPATLPADPNCQNQPYGWRVGFHFAPGSSHVTLRHSQASGLTAGVHINGRASHHRVIGNTLIDNVVMSVNNPTHPYDDSGAWGLVLNGDDNEIAYNYFSGNLAWCSYDFGIEGASIEVYEGQRNHIHHNVSRNDPTFSELGSSSRRRSQDNTFAYNLFTTTLSQGGQFLTLRGPNSPFGPTPGTKAFHNTVYMPNAKETQGVVCYGDCDGSMLELRNNILVVGWKALYADHPFPESNNLYWRPGGNPFVQNVTIDRSSKKADPRFIDVARGDFRLAQDSPALNNGTDGRNLGAF